MKFYSPEQIISPFAKEFQSAKPFPHVVIDYFLPQDTAISAAATFPGPDDISWYKYENPLEIKLAQDDIKKLNFIHREILQYMNSQKFVKALEQLSGVNGLKPDPSFRGGGLHQMLDGGKLDIHEDYNIHPVLGWRRRLNAILFLNPVWISRWGGGLELWDKNMKTRARLIIPLMNRLVIFATDQNGNHGVPDAIKCPAGVSRKSIATYYYTDDAKGHKPHSTLYKRRPQDPKDRHLDALRAKRAKGRLSSNIKEA